MNNYGEVIELWRYPVKSMLGESCQEIELEARGVVNDRLYAIKNIDGKIGSGKDTRRFRKIDGLLQFQSLSVGNIPKVKFPDGRIMSFGDPETDAALSTALGQPVTLERETDACYLDDQPVHVVTRGWLSRMQGTAPEGIPDSRRFRPNIVLSAESPVEELSWLGKRIRIGIAELRFTSITERCGMVALAQKNLDKAPRILRHIAKELDLNFGIYAEVVTPGSIKLGDKVVAVDDES